ncbi:MAG TPA: AAA family ATPase, partial [Haliangium sp.]|nr:AAA family ATPase [Haliangium sp.]
CVADEESHAVLVTAPAGMGKSRLRYEFEQALRRRGDDLEVLLGQGDAVSAGSPFVMIAPAIRRLVGILEGEPIEERWRKLQSRLAETVAPAELERVILFLGELIGAPYPDDHSPSLRVARKDPLLLGRLMQAAWIDWLRAECSHRPLLLLLEDLHWGDLPSIQYIGAALHQLDDHRFMVLALARPEVHNVFPKLWPETEVYEMPLHALSRKASLSLIRDVLGPRVTEDVASAVVERAGGNAFYLEELIRAVAEDGADQLPDTILGMVQNRLDALGPEAKQILRAGSIFGEVFWQGGVEAMLGQSGAYRVSEWLEDLVAREVVSRQPEARVPGEAEYKFRHALVRDGAYAMLTEEDRRLGHALAGAWLEQAGEQDALVLAEHFMRGGDPERAIPCFHRAAAQSLEGNDLAAVVSRAERAVMAGARGAMLGSLRALQSVASYWLSNYTNSQRYGGQAVDLLPSGSDDWFMAVGNAIVSSARLGDYVHMDELLARAMDVQCPPGAEAKQILCLCRGTFQLVFTARFTHADQVLARITALAAQAGELDPLTIAQIHHVQGLRASHAGDVGTCLRHLEAVVAAFEEAGDTRNVALERTTVAWCWAELGYFGHAANLGERSLAFCRQSGIQQAITYAKVNLGYILSLCEGRLSEARRLLDEGIEECRLVGNPRLEGWARAHLTWVDHQAGDHAAAEREATRAVGLLTMSPGLQAWAMAARARALLAQGLAQPALEQARSAMAILDHL